MVRRSLWQPPLPPVRVPAQRTTSYAISLFDWFGADGTTAPKHKHETNMQASKATIHKTTIGIGRHFAPYSLVSTFEPDHQNAGGETRDDSDESTTLETLWNLGLSTPGYSSAATDVGWR